MAVASAHKGACLVVHTRAILSSSQSLPSFAWKCDDLLPILHAIVDCGFRRRAGDSRCDAPPAPSSSGCDCFGSNWPPSAASIDVAPG